MPSTIVPLPALGETWGGGQHWLCDLSKEVFVHFTLPERAEQILTAKKLLLRSPYTKFGPEKVYAVSSTWGSFVPEVQTTHYRSHDLVGVLFKTSVAPKGAFTEEVFWDQDVPLKNVKVVSYAQAVALIRGAPFQVGDQDMVQYKAASLKRLAHRIADKVWRPFVPNSGSFEVARVPGRRAKTDTVVVMPPQIERDPYPFTGFINFQGLEIDVENRQGEVRSGTDRDGHQWSIFMHAHYGEIRDTQGTDGDNLDIYVGPNAVSDLVVIVRQAVPDTGAYDEDKLMVGFDTPEEALACFRKQYDRPGFYGGHTVKNLSDIKRWLGDKRNFGKRVYRVATPQTQVLVNRIASQYLRAHP